MSTILKVEDISKQYRLGLVGSATLIHDLNRFWHKVRGKEDPYLQLGSVNDRSEQATEDYVWALNDINFEVEEGEVLGIIGKNGAGKSTLLKLLSRVTSPTTGIIKSRGRIASLLEVGTGFHPELTGRENIYLNGAILGMSKKEITSKIDEIIDFSGCEMYIDTPTKRYSSGMTVRLAFAVAAHLEPDILVIDEVLAVGDAEFQRKAIGKMQDISKGQGRTVLFVSHNMASVKQLCTRAIVLDKGSVVYSGDVDECVQYYLKHEDELATNRKEIQWAPSEAPGSADFKLLGVSTAASDGTLTGAFMDSQTIHICIRTKVEHMLRNMRLNLKLVNSEEVIVFTTSSHLNEEVEKVAGEYVYKVEIPAFLLNQDTYKIGLQAGIPKERELLSSTMPLGFSIEKVSNSGTLVKTVLPGIIAPKIGWKIDKV